MPWAAGRGPSYPSDSNHFSNKFKNPSPTLNPPFARVRGLEGCLPIPGPLFKLVQKLSLPLHCRFSGGKPPFPPRHCRSRRAIAAPAAPLPFSRQRAAAQNPPKFHPTPPDSQHPPTTPNPRRRHHTDPPTNTASAPPSAAPHPNRPVHKTDSPLRFPADSPSE